MPDLEQAEALLRIAGRDFYAAQGMKDASVFPDEIFGFHAQQSVEKCFKAWLSLLDIEYPRIHDLDELCQTVESVVSIPADWRSLSKLTPFAVQFRYDVLDASHSIIDRSHVLSLIEKLHSHVSALASSVK